MAKELPYFRFEPSEWDNGNIQMCSRESKGLFIDLCSLYWSRLGELPYALALQKLCNGIESALQELKSHDIFGVIDGQIVIEFLDEQLSERGQVSEKRRNAAQKRWNDANALQMQSKSNAKRIEENRREEKKKEEKIIDAGKPATIEEREIVFRDKLIPYLETYGKEMLRAFYDYWTEKNEGGKKMKFEMQKVFEIEKRLRTWSRNNFENNGKSKGGVVKPSIDRLTSLINQRHGITGTGQ
jgi:hypothetical protein